MTTLLFSFLILCGRRRFLHVIFFFFKTSLLLGAEWCHHLEECARVWSACRWPCFGVWFCAWGLVFPGFVVKLWVRLYKQLQSCDTLHSLSHSAVTASPQIPTWVYIFFLLLDPYPLTNTTPLLNVDGIASLSLYLSSFIFFFLWVWALAPSPSPFHEASILCHPELNRRPCYPALPLVKPDHMVTEWPALLCYPPSSLGVHME